MYNLELKYKEFNVGLDKLLEFCQDQSSLCCGISANSSIQIHFTEQPSDEIIAAIDDKWNNLTEDDFPYESLEEQKLRIKAEEDAINQPKKVDPAKLQKLSESLDIMSTASSVKLKAVCLQIRDILKDLQ